MSQDDELATERAREIYERSIYTKWQSEVQALVVAGACFVGCVRGIATVALSDDRTGDGWL